MKEFKGVTLYLVKDNNGEIYICRTSLDDYVCKDTMVEIESPYGNVIGDVVEVLPVYHYEKNEYNFIMRILDEFTREYHDPLPRILRQFTTFEIKYDEEDDDGSYRQE